MTQAPLTGPEYTTLTQESSKLVTSIENAVEAVKVDDTFLPTNDCDAKREAVMVQHGRCMEMAMTIYREDDEEAQHRWFQAKQICYNMITKVMAECHPTEL